jgi:peptidoglycan-associated lipoprotein
MKIMLAVPLLAVLLAGCAHRPLQPLPVGVPPKPVATNLPTAPAPALPGVSKAQSDADLDALLNGLVIHFAFDQADLTPEATGRLVALAEAMRTHAGVRLKIAGNCDELGTEEYNLALGQRRADSVRSYLVTLGVTPSRVETVTYGEEKPVDSGHSEAARAANRRAELGRN